LYICARKYILDVFSGGNMQINGFELPVDLPDAMWLQDYFSDYANPKARIGRLVNQGVLYRLKRGLYIKAASARNAFVLGQAANRIYGPSYVSFVYALRWHGLIPEHVVHITSATYAKGRSKRYDTPVASFLYQDVPSAAYPHDITFAADGRRRFLIASAEKALCDTLYQTAGVRSMKQLDLLLFENLRIDPNAFHGLDHNKITLLAGYYKTTTLGSFAKFIRKLNHA
jgi:hypothetical protein